MRIVPLAECADLLPQVAAWGFAEWGHLSPGQTLQSRIVEIGQMMNVDHVPVALVALDDAGLAAGTASLIFDDLEGDPRNPWLASVFVPIEHRRRGVASALVGAVEDAARRFGYPRLHLFTTSATRLYAGLGWCTLEQREYRGEHIQVMDKAL